MKQSFYIWRLFLTLFYVWHRGMIATLRELDLSLQPLQNNIWYNTFKIWIYAIEAELSIRINDLNRYELLKREIIINFKALPTQAHKNRAAKIFRVSRYLGDIFNIVWWEFNNCRDFFVKRQKFTTAEFLYFINHTKSVI